MITIEQFKNLYQSTSDGSEFEIHFKDSADEFMIIKYSDHASFQRCGVETGSGEEDYPSIDALLLATLIDDIQLTRDWPEIELIVFNSWCNIKTENDLKEIKNALQLNS